MKFYDNLIYHLCSSNIMFILRTLYRLSSIISFYIQHKGCQNQLFMYYEFFTKRQKFTIEIVSFFLNGYSKIVYQLPHLMISKPTVYTGRVKNVRYILLNCRIKIEKWNLGTSLGNISELLVLITTLHISPKWSFCWITQTPRCKYPLNDTLF